MSLKVVHFFFILCSIVLSCFYGFWCLNNYDWAHSPLFVVSGFLSLSGTGGLLYYLVCFLKKTKGFGFLVWWVAFSVLFWSENSLACSVCQFKSPDSPLVLAIRQGVWAILILLVPVLAGFFALFIFWSKRDSRYLNQS